MKLSSSEDLQVFGPCFDIQAPRAGAFDNTEDVLRLLYNAVLPRQGT
jgi:hypothetical protein